MICRNSADDRAQAAVRMCLRKVPHRTAAAGDEVESSLDARRMSTSTVACYSFAAPRPRRSARKASSQSFLAGAAVTALALGCAWTVYANIFAASPYPQLGSASFDEPVNRRWTSVVVHNTPPVDGSRAAQLEPPPLISAPATVPSGPSLSFDDRFAAAAAQGVAPAPQPDTSKLAAAPKAQPESAKLAEASRPKEAPSSRAPVQVAAIPPAPAPPSPSQRRRQRRRSTTWRNAPRRR